MSLVAREVINGTWFFLNLSLAIVFWRQVWFARRTVPDWYDDTTTRAIIGLAVYFLGSSVMRAWVWMLLMAENRGDDAAFLADRYQLAMLAGAIAITGALCCIRSFSPSHWPRWLWIAVGAVSVGIPLAAAYLV